MNRIDPSGHFAITALLIAIGVGAALGAAGDVASQMIFQGKSFSEVDWTSVGASAVSGAVSGAIGFFTAGICSSSLLGAMAVGAISNAAEYVAYNAVAGNDITWEGLGMSAATGAIAAGIGYGIGKFKENIKSQCFVAGTLVLTSVGFAAIETLKTGDMVLAENPETGEKGVKRVVQTFVNETDELVHVTVDGKEIVTTPKHPFYVPNKGWTGAIHLRAGDILVLVNGEYAVATKVEHELLESPVKVYNFEVEDFHTYYVSDMGVLVHNVCGKFYEANRVDNGVEIGKEVSRKKALQLIRNGKDVCANSRAAAKSLAKDAFGNSKVYSEIHKFVTNAMPHYHDKMNHIFHVFYMQ